MSHKQLRKRTVRQMQRRQEAHVVRRADVEGLVGEIRRHKSPEVLNHGTSCVTVKICWDPRARKPIGYKVTGMQQRCVILSLSLRNVLRLRM